MLQTKHTTSTIKKKVLSPQALTNIRTDALQSFTKLLNLTSIASQHHNRNNASNRFNVNQSTRVNSRDGKADHCTITHIASAHQLVLTYIVKSNLLQLCISYAQVLTGSNTQNYQSENVRLQPLHINATIMIATVCSHVCYSQCDKQITKQFVSQGANACVCVLLNNLNVLIHKVQVKGSIA